jgi:hypothetical protein
MNDKYFVATCKHVVTPEYEVGELRFLYRSDVSFQAVDKKIIKSIRPNLIYPNIHKTFPIKLPIINSIYSDDEDDLVLLAVYVAVIWFILLQNRRQASLMKNQIENSKYNSFETIVVNIDAEFVKNSDIRPFFYSGREINPGDPLYEKSISMGEVLIDFFDHILTVVEYNASLDSHEG